MVLICTYERIGITCYNIRSLLKQGSEVMLIVSSNVEFGVYLNLFPGIYIFMHSNSPLGAKWQYGVQQCCNLKAEYVIILGSDDILGSKYLESCIKLAAKGHDFIGCKQWFVHHNGKAFLCNYQITQPLGGGRFYSKELLDKMEWKLFQQGSNRHLDDYAMLGINKNSVSPYVSTDVIGDGLEIHAIKGNWVTMNPFNRNHKNIKIVAEFESKVILPDL